MIDSSKKTKRLNGESNFPKTRFKLVLLIVSTVVALFIVEIGVRIVVKLDPTMFWYPVDGANLGSLSGSEGSPYSSGQWSMLVHHMPKRSWSGKRAVSRLDIEDGIGKNLLQHNSLGMRGPEIGPKKGERILLLGDSFLEADEIVYSQLAGSLATSAMKNAGVEIVQQGYSSWSPTLEFAWYKHFGYQLEADRVFLFVYGNDFTPGLENVKSDDAYEKKYKYDENGYPLYIPEFKPTWGREHIYLIRACEFGLKRLSTITPKLFKHLFNPEISITEKITRIYRRVAYYEQLIREKVSYDKSELLSIVEEKLFKGNKYSGIGLNLLILRLHESNWPEEWVKSVNASMNAIYHFHEYLQKNKKELVVFYVPSGYDVGKNEFDFVYKDEFGKNYDYGRKSHGLEMYLSKTLKNKNIPFLSLRSPLIEYKNKHCSQCKNFLYFKYNGHWNQNGQKAVAEILENYIKMH
jgi:hypothetical protein